MESTNSPLLESLLLGDTNPNFIDEKFDANLLTPSAFVEYWCDEVENGVSEGGEKCNVNDDGDDVYEKNKVVSGGVVVNVKNMSSAGESKINIIGDVTIRAGFQPNDDDGDKETSMLRMVLTTHPSIARNKNTFYNMLRSGENEIEVQMSGEPVKRRRKCAPTQSDHEEWSPTSEMTPVSTSPTPPPPSFTSEMTPVSTSPTPPPPSFASEMTPVSTSPTPPPPSFASEITHVSTSPTPPPPSFASEMTHVSTSLMLPPPPLPPLESPSNVMCDSPKSDWLNVFSASQKEALLGVLAVRESVEKDVRESEVEVDSIKKQLENLKKQLEVAEKKLCISNERLELLNLHVNFK